MAGGTRRCGRALDSDDSTSFKARGSARSPSWSHRCRCARPAAIWPSTFRGRRRRSAKRTCDRDGSPRACSPRARGRPRGDARLHLQPGPRHRHAGPGTPPRRRRGRRRPARRAGTRLTPRRVSAGGETDMRFQGRVVIVTGAARGIGAVTAEAFAHEGARVAALDLDGPGVDAVVKRLRETGVDILGFGADAAAPAEIRGVVDAVLGRWQRVDVLVNNAGGFAAIRATEDITDEEWASILRSNLTTAFVCSRAVLPVMKRQRAGRIVNVASVVAPGGAVRVTSHYAAAKA